MIVLLLLRRVNALIVLLVIAQVRCNLLKDSNRLMLLQIGSFYQVQENAAMLGGESCLRQIICLGGGTRNVIDNTLTSDLVELAEDLLLAICNAVVLGGAEVMAECLLQKHVKLRIT